MDGFEWMLLTFVPGGRIGRLHLVLGAIAGLLLCSVAALVTAVFGLLADALSMEEGTTAGVILSTLSVLFITAGWSYVVVVLMAKRLHDLGVTAWHVLWIVGTWIMALASIGSGSDMVALVLCLALALIACWLLLVPGVAGANRFGVTPG